MLPAAERHLADELGEIGMQMTKRRVELVAPRAGQIAADMACAASGNKALFGLGVFALGWLILAMAKPKRRLLT